MIKYELEMATPIEMPPGIALKLATASIKQRFGGSCLVDIKEQGDGVYLVIFYVLES